MRDLPFVARLLIAVLVIVLVTFVASLLMTAAM